MSFAKIMVMGNLTRDPEVRYLQSGTTVASFDIAVNERRKDANGEVIEDVSFIPCSAFGRTAELIGQYFRKGQQIFVDGRLRQDNWEDKNTGQRRSRLKMLVEQLHFIGRKEDGGEGGPQPQESYSGDGGNQRRGPASRQQQRRQPPADAYYDEEDEIPF